MESPESIDAVVEQVDQRNLWRRKEDVRRNLILVGMATLLFAGGVAWATALAAVDQKVDKTTFIEHVAQSDRRFLADSITRALLSASLARIEAKQDSTNERLHNLICDKKPAYCR
jgi:hypothetical protein